MSRIAIGPMAIVLCLCLFAARPVLAGLDLFEISQPTHAIVDAKTDVYPCCGDDNSNTFSSGYIYNMFGATNPGVEGAAYDMIFAAGPTDFVEFHTALPVDLTSVGLTVGSESTTRTVPAAILPRLFSSTATQAIRRRSAQPTLSATPIRSRRAPRIPFQ